MKTIPNLLRILLLWAALLPAVVQAQLTFTTNNGTITITGYNGNPGPIIIPSTTNGLPVVNIANNAFIRKTVSTLVIPNSVTNIGTSAFDSCPSLTSVTIGNIGQRAFAACTKLATLTIPGSVVTIGDQTFSGSIKLSAITADPANSFFSSTSGVLFNKKQTTIVQYPPAGAGRSYTIPNTVTNIGNNAFFMCAALTNVTIPGSVINIGDNGFYRCTGLTSVTIPDSVIALGLGTFYECFNLTNVTMGTNLANIGTQAFQECGLITVTIPNSVSIIQNSVFFECANLATITLGTNVAIIYNNIFLDCSNLTGIYFLGNAPSVLYSDFDYDDDIATVYYLPWTTGWPAPGEQFGGCPTALWLPQTQTSDGRFGVQTNQFGFNITWASDMVVVVEACTDLANPDWTPVGTNTLTGGSSYFSDSQWTNYPGRFYRLRSP